MLQSSKIRTFQKSGCVLNRTFYRSALTASIVKTSCGHFDASDVLASTNLNQHSFKSVGFLIDSRNNKPSNCFQQQKQKYSPSRSTFPSLFSISIRPECGVAMTNSIPAFQARNFHTSTQKFQEKSDSDENSPNSSPAKKTRSRKSAAKSADLLSFSTLDKNDGNLNSNEHLEAIKDAEITPKPREGAEIKSKSVSFFCF